MSFLKHVYSLFHHEFTHLFVTTVFIVIGIAIKDKLHTADSLERSFIYIVIILCILLYIILRYLDWQKELTEQKKFQESIEKLKIEQEKSKSLSVVFKGNYIENNNLVDIAYQTSLNEVKNAEHQIVIVADYSPINEEFIVSPKRQEYYKVIEDVLIEKINRKSNNSFTYIRYMQRDEATFKKIQQKKGLIDEYELVQGDEQAFHHCKRVLEITENNESINVELYVTKNIPSLPSILIIDNNKLLFTIPERIQFRKKVETAGVILLEDNSFNNKEIVKPFMRIVKSLNKDNDEFVTLKSVSNFQEIAFSRWS